jgi:hypothetical protein
MMYNIYTPLIKETALMGTATLNKIGSLRDKKGLRGREIGPTDGKSAFERVAHRLRLEGHDATFVEENDDDLDISKYLSEESMKYLALKKLNNT